MNTNIKHTLYHVTTLNKYRKYRATGYIKKPVRGFTTELAAMAWAMKTSRTMIVEIDCYNTHKLPDHHNKFGDAFWNDDNVLDFKVLYSTHYHQQGTKDEQ